MTRTIPVLAPLCAALALAACDAARPIAAEGSGVGACVGCHGDPAREGDPLARAAPPASTSGGDGGAHLAHLSGSTFRAPLACAECHAVPTLVDHADAAVDVAMTRLAAADGATPAWSAGAGTCSGVYCHGATLAGGPAATPAWSSTSDLTCTSCHGLPPAAPHPDDPACDGCHLGYGPATVNAATHLDGRVQASHGEGYADPAQHGYEASAVGLATCKACHGTDLAGGSAGASCNGCHAEAGFPAWTTTCTFCHGDPGTGRSSPPVDTRGRSATANVSVGVHASHVTTALTTPIACTECHPDRTDSDVRTDAAHVDGDARAEVAFGPLATAGGAPASYVRASDVSATCASTYCHGRFPGGANGGAGATVGWTSATQVGCSSCHGNPPPSGRDSHHSGLACSECHGHGGAGAAHVNGAVDVALVSGSYSSTTGTCSSFTCHGKSHGSGWSW